MWKGPNKEKKEKYGAEENSGRRLDTFDVRAVAGNLSRGTTPPPNHNTPLCPTRFTTPSQPVEQHSTARLRCKTYA